MNREDPHTRLLCCLYRVCVFFFFGFVFYLLWFSLEWDHCAESLCQLCCQQPLDSYQGRECEIISRHGDCPLAPSRASLQHLISTLLMLCVTTEILYSQRETDREGTDSPEATTLHAQVYQSNNVTEQCFWPFIILTKTQLFNILSGMIQVVKPNPNCWLYLCAVEVWLKQNDALRVNTYDTK